MEKNIADKQKEPEDKKTMVLNFQMLLPSGK